jgi:hypothetical protein
VDDAGTLAVGAQAHLAIWDSGGGDLSDLDKDPRLVRLVVAGRTVLDELGLEKNGLEKNGLEKNGLAKTGLEETRLENTL